MAQLVSATATVGVPKLVLTSVARPLFISWSPCGRYIVQVCRSWIDAGTSRSTSDSWRLDT